MTDLYGDNDLCIEEPTVTQPSNHSGGGAGQRPQGPTVTSCTCKRWQELPAPSSCSTLHKRLFTDIQFRYKCLQVVITAEKLFKTGFLKLWYPTNKHGRQRQTQWLNPDLMDMMLILMTQTTQLQLTIVFIIDPSVDNILDYSTQRKYSHL